jgi:DNA replicative helicase MCM subunit Mcm2 (Cdc46/Mcm family)
MVAPDVIGYNHAKKNLLLCAASTGADPRKRKVNVGFIEDSGFAKSTLPRKAVKVFPNRRYESGKFIR